MSRIAKRTVAELCDEFVCNDEDKSLEKFLHEKHAELSKLFPKHPFGKLKAKIISIYVYTLQKHKYSKERISQLKLVNELIWVQYFASKPEVIAKQYKDQLYAIFYNKVLGVACEVPQDIEDNVSAQEVTGESCLDMISISLLKRFHSLSTFENCVLKLCLSNIVNLSTKEYYDYYEKELPQHVFDSLKSIEAKKQLSEAVRRRLERAIEGTKQEYQQQQQRKDPVRGVEDQVFCIYDYVYTSIPLWLKNQRNAEFLFVSKLSHILSLVLADTSLSNEAGETASVSTKKIRRSNEKHYGWSSNTRTSTMNMIGRKSDIIVINQNGVELAIFEFKSAEKSNLQVKKQEGKSIRLNSCLKSVYSCLGAEDVAVGMDWIGNEGVSYTMVKTQGINLVLHSSNMKIPLRREELWDAEFKETLVELYNLKAFFLKLNEQLSEITQEDYEKAELKEIPTTMLSPKLKASSSKSYT